MYVSEYNAFRPFANQPNVELSSQPSINQSSGNFRNLLVALLENQGVAKETSIDRLTELMVFKERTKKKMRGFITKDGNNIKIISLQTTKL